MIRFLIFIFTLVKSDGRIDILPQLIPPEIPFGKTENVTIPKNFDWRKNHFCAKLPPDSGACAASYAISVASAASDRSCAKGGKVFSAARILQCCKQCGGGCYGGYPWKAMKFLTNTGSTERECQPFPELRSFIRSRTLNCRPLQCWDTNKNYTQIKIKGYYRIKENEIEKEIFTKGPVISYMDFYQDLLTYSKGVYIENNNQKLGKITVKIVGWGENEMGKYWIVENSWGTQWGDEGTFYIIRGINFCNIEKYVFGIST